MKTVAIVLAAGFGRRMKRHKPSAPYGDSTLLETVLNNLPATEILVVGQAEDGWSEGLAIERSAGWVVNPEPERGLGSSIAVGVCKARNADVVLIALADMPRVPKVHFEALLREASESGIAASLVEGRKQVPAAFRSEYFEQLIRLSDDHGARTLFLESTVGISLAPDLATDVDYS